MTSFHFTTADRRGVRRTWHEFVDEKFGLSSVNLGDEATFSGDIRCSSVGFLTFAEIRATHELAERSSARVAKARHEHFVVVLLRAGKLKITQAGRECVLSPNTFTLFDCNGPYTFHHVEPTEVLDVIVPAGAMRARLKEPEAYVAQSRSADSGLDRVMADMFQSLAREAPLIPEKAADDCARRVADMMGVLFDSAGDHGLPIGESAVRSAIYRRCVAFIENISTIRVSIRQRLPLLPGFRCAICTRYFTRRGNRWAITCAVCGLRARTTTWPTCGKGT